MSSIRNITSPPSDRHLRQSRFQAVQLALTHWSADVWYVDWQRFHSTTASYIRCVANRCLTGFGDDEEVTTLFYYVFACIYICLSYVEVFFWNLINVIKNNAMTKITTTRSIYNGCDCGWWLYQFLVNIFSLNLVAEVELDLNLVTN